MPPKHPSPGTRTSRIPSAFAASVSHPSADRFQLLETALDQAGFWPNLARARRQKRVQPQDFQILIKPDLDFFEKGAATGTDPALIEYLIDLLHDHGYTQISVGEGRNSFDLWLENRDVLVLADLAGYRFVTSGGHSYDILDLGEDLVEVPFPAGNVLSGTCLARAWVEADYRVCFAKNKTDEETYYALCLHTLLGVLPLRDKDYHYHYRLKQEDVIVELLQQTPVHFSLIDGFVSSHGSAGSRQERPLDTRTFIAASDPILADWVGAVKMGLDPFVSPLNAAALRRIGLPLNHKIQGDLTPYGSWINVHPLMANSVQSRNQWMEFSRMVKPWLQRVNSDLFPFKEIIDEQVNAYLRRYLDPIDEKPLAWWGMAALNYWSGATHDALTAYQTLYDKKNLRWIEAPLNCDPSAYSSADYEGVAAYLEPLADLIQQSAADPNGLRWRDLDGSVLFEFSRVIPVPFDDFVAQVDISKAIQFMNDYIGGTAVAVVHDEQMRVTHQVERNLYLPQPNYLVLYRGKVIDVTKLETITYSETQQKIYWKTIKSENGSAEYDDGIVTFAKTPQAETRVSVMGRQQFTLPLFWQVFNLDSNPPLKGYLVANAYTTFFSQTMANFESRFEGREVRIGRPWNAVESEPGAPGTEKWYTENLKVLVEKVGEVVSQNMVSQNNVWAWSSKAPTNTGGVLDEEGFLHFKGSSTDNSAQSPSQSEKTWPGIPGLPPELGETLRDFLSGLITAMEKDWGLYRFDEDSK